MTFKPIPSDRTADAVVRQVEGLILDGVLRSGDRLPPERDLAETLGVSRPILRDALAMLDDRGLITARQGGGTFVADVTGEVFGRAIVDLIRETPRARADYLEFRIEMDALAAELAAQRATEADRAILAGILAAMAEAHGADDPRREAELDVEFHLAISEATHNIVMIHTLRACYRLLADGLFYSRGLLYEDPAARDRLYAQHVAIGAAIAKGDPAGARAAAAEHMRHVRDEVEARLRHAARAAVAGLRLSQAESRRPRSPARPRRTAATRTGDGATAADRSSPGTSE